MAIKTNFKVVLAKVKTTLDKAVDQAHVKALGEEAIRLITVRTRLGFGVNSPGAQRRRLKPLAESYVAARRKSRDKLSQFTAPSRSNLTFSGQMLESLKLVAKRSGAAIEPSGIRDDGLSNQKVASYVTKAGRAFISLSDLELKKLIRFYENDILGRLLRKRGLTK